MTGAFKRSAGHVVQHSLLLRSTFWAFLAGVAFLTRISLRPAIAFAAATFVFTPTFAFVRFHDPCMGSIAVKNGLVPVLFTVKVGGWGVIGIVDKKSAQGNYCNGAQQEFGNVL